MTPLLSDITVNGESIPAERIAAEAQNHPAPKTKPGLAWRAAARALAVRALLLQEARRRGIAAQVQEVAPGQWETEDEALVRQVLDQAIAPEAPGEDAIRAAYAATPDRWRAPTLYEAAHILLPVPRGDAARLAGARAEAAEIAARLARDPRTFDALARKHSACPSRENGGRLGQLISGDTVPEFEAALDALEEGAITEQAVATRYGLHLIRLDARAPGAVLPYENVRPRVAEMLEKAAWARAARDFIATLAETAEVTGIDLKAA